MQTWSEAALPTLGGIAPKRKRSTTAGLHGVTAASHRTNAATGAGQSYSTALHTSDGLPTQTRRRRRAQRGQRLI